MPTHRCAICQCLFKNGSLKHYENHAQGARHKRKLLALQISDPGIQPAEQEGRVPCFTCKKSISEKYWDTHLKGGLHQKRLERISRSAASTSARTSGSKTHETADIPMSTKPKRRAQKDTGPQPLQHANVKAQTQSSVEKDTGRNAASSNLGTGLAASPSALVSSSDSSSDDEPAVKSKSSKKHGGTSGGDASAQGNALDSSESDDSEEESGDENELNPSVACEERKERLRHPGSVQTQSKASGKSKAPENIASSIPASSPAGLATGGDTSDKPDSSDDESTLHVKSVDGNKSREEKVQHLGSIQAQSQTSIKAKATEKTGNALKVKREFLDGSGGGDGNPTFNDDDMDICKDKNGFNGDSSDTDSNEEEVNNENEYNKSPSNNREDQHMSEVEQHQESAFDSIVKKRSPHIYRLVELAPNLPHLLIQGQRRLIASKEGIESSDTLSEQEVISFEILCDLITGLRKELIRMSDRDILDLAETMKVSGRAARGSDTHRSKTCIIDILNFLDPKSKGENETLSLKSNRGFQNDKLGEMLCPVDLDWGKEKIRKRLRRGKIIPTASQFMRGLYSDCKCNPDDYEDGLLKNEVLVLLAKSILVGPTSALKTTAGPSRSSTNAGILKMTEMTPRIIAYCACLLRFSISDKEMWSLKDGSFDVLEMYWNIVGIFDGSESSNDLLRWWNSRIFGSQVCKPEKRPPSTLELLKAQRAAKRARVETETNKLGT